MRLIILSAVALSAAGLQHGLTHLWTTPILRHQLVGTDGPDADLLQAMQSAVRHKWSSFADDCGLTAEGETVNDRFFAYQREAFERGDAPFLELEGSKAEREAYETLRSAWLENAREYVAIVASEEAAADMLRPRRTAHVCLGVRPRGTQHARTARPRQLGHVWRILRGCASTRREDHV